jgi:uncharacterized protein YbjT (DUF2867 family)
MILVVGATGQLGSLVVRRLRKQGRPVRALVRSDASAEVLSETGADLVRGDLRDPLSLSAAVAGVEAIVATANALAPSRPGDTPAALARGYAELVSRAANAGVRRFVFASIPVTPVDQKVPEARLKRVTEQRLERSRLSHLSVRLAPFTEVWLALVGSSIPSRGERNGTLDRPYPFLKRFRRLTGRTVDDRGLLVLPGPASRRHAFISVHDAADVLAASVDTTTLTGPVDVGGPEILSWADVADVYGELLGRRIRVASLPATSLLLAQKALTPVAPSAANVMGMNRLMAMTDTAWDSSKVIDELGVGPLRTVRRILSEKATLPR